MICFLSLVSPCCNPSNYPLTEKHMHCTKLLSFKNDTPMHKNNTSKFSKYEPHHKYKQDPQDNVQNDM